MVSTRGIKYKFSEGERVLCYEPDQTKAKVLYDSKVMGIYETKDKRGRRLVQYKIHFQGWNPSWDRNVNSDFVLKDTPQNRQLQKDLAEKAQLQLAAYLYRKERKKQRVRKTTGNSNSELSSPFQARASSEENSSTSTLEKTNENFIMKEDTDSESYSSSGESGPDEERVFLRVGTAIKAYLEYDQYMVCMEKRKHILPCRIPVLSILENFVKQSAIKLVFSSSQDTQNPRRRNPVSRNADKKEKEYEKLVNTISLLKEVADGLRTYINFTMKDYLLYTVEKEQAAQLLSEEYLKNFTYTPTPGLSPEFLTKTETDVLNLVENTDASTSGGVTENSSEEPLRRKLRSHKSEDCTDTLLETGLSSIASTSSGSTTPQPHVHPTNSLEFMKSFPSTNLGIPLNVKEQLQKVLTWTILPPSAKAEASMIYGATHLARLLVKLPDFLNASAMSDIKLKVLLQHLDTFMTYLESHREWFGEHNYEEAPKLTDEESQLKSTDEESPEKSSDKESPEKLTDKESTEKSSDNEFLQKSTDEECTQKSTEEEESPEKLTDKESSQKSTDEENAQKSTDEECPQKQIKKKLNSK